MTTDTDIQKNAIRITWIGAIVDGVLGILKVVVGLFSQSGALIADGIHSLSDLATDALVVVTLQLSQQPADEEHPWGHGRIETLGTALLGAILIAVAGAMGWNSLQHLLADTSPTIPGWPALLVAFISILSKEAIYRYTRRVGEKLSSDLLIANAWHSRTDALSSIVVFIGIGGSLFGLYWMDSVAALLVAGLVAYIGWGLNWQSLQQLIDTAPPVEALDEIRQQSCAIPGVKDLHDLKVRYSGPNLSMEVHILVDPLCSASEGHFISEQVRDQLHQHNPQLKQLIIHVDTRDDQTEDLSLSEITPPRTEDISAPRIRPDRVTIVNLVTPWLSSQQLRLLRLDLHYHQHTVTLELCLHWPVQSTPSKPPTDLINSLRRHLGQPDWLARIRISYGEDG